MLLIHVTEQTKISSCLVTIQKCQRQLQVRINQLFLAWVRMLSLEILYHFISIREDLILGQNMMFLLIFAKRIQLEKMPKYTKYLRQKYLILCSILKNNHCRRRVLEDMIAIKNSESMEITKHQPIKVPFMRIQFGKASKHLVTNMNPLISKNTKWTALKSGKYQNH